MGVHAKQGIAENFIGILRTEERTASRTLLRIVLFALGVAFLAALAVDLPDSGRLFGVAFGLVILTACVGAGLGLLVARFLTLRRYNASLAEGWNRWMRFSVACSRIEEVERRVRGRPATRPVGRLAALWTLILFATLIMLLVTFVDGVPSINKTPVFAAYGLYLGLRLGHTISLLRWVRGLLGSVDDLVRKGEIGLWGVV